MTNADGGLKISLYENQRKPAADPDRKVSKPAADPDPKVGIDDALNKLWLNIQQRTGKKVLNLNDVTRSKDLLASAMNTHLEALGINPSMIDASMIFLLFDTEPHPNGDGEVHQKEFVNLVKAFISNPQKAVKEAQARLKQSQGAFSLIVIGLSMLNGHLAKMTPQAKANLQNGVKCAVAKAAGVDCENVECTMTQGSIIIDLKIKASNDAAATAIKDKVDKADVQGEVVKVAKATPGVSDAFDGPIEVSKPEIRIVQGAKKAPTKSSEEVSGTSSICTSMMAVGLSGLLLAANL